MNRTAHLVLFDIDGTLVDSAGFDGELYEQAVRTELGIDLRDDRSSYRNVTDSGILDEVIDDAGLDADRQRVHARVRQTFVGLVSDYLSARGGRLPEIRGARAFVERLSARPDVAVAFATGGWGETAAMKLRAIGLAPESLCLASASDALTRIEIMQIAARRALGRAPARRQTYFGDGPWDLRASAEAGFDFVAIGERVEHATRFPDFSLSESILIELGLGD